MSFDTGSFCAPMKSATLFLWVVLASQIALAQESVPLYDGPIPGAIDAPNEEALRDTSEPYPFLVDISRPTLTRFPAAKSNSKHAAVIILPGGAYHGVSYVKEGDAIAHAFNEIGVAAFVLKYRMPNPKWMASPSTGPLQDAQQAMHVVRSHAREWQIDPQRVGIVGFSAGGHLAATLATKYATSVATSKPADDLRPDFVILGYPVISMSDELTHAESRLRLLGPTPTPEAIREYSAELNVTGQTPPTFIVHAADDHGVNVENSIRFFGALQAHNVPVELFVIPHGGHGFGLFNAATHDRWFDRCADWLRGEGWIE
jgi:acetyl esterase/lipase